MCKTLERLGWVFDHIRGSHHIYIAMRQAGLTDADL